MISAGLEAEALILSGRVSTGKDDWLNPCCAIWPLNSFSMQSPFVPVNRWCSRFAGASRVWTSREPGVGPWLPSDLFVQPAMIFWAGAEPRRFRSLKRRYCAAGGKARSNALFACAAYWSDDTPQCLPDCWQGSGDVVAMAMQIVCWLCLRSARG